MADGFLGIAINIDGEWSTLIRPVWISTPKTWLESSCQAPNHLYAPAILRSKCWYPPTAPRALKKGPLSNLHLLSNQKKTYQQKQWIYRLGWILTSPDFKTQIRLEKPKFQKIWWVNQIISNLDQTLWNHTIHQNAKAKSWPNHYHLFVSEAPGHLLANEFH